MRRGFLSALAAAGVALSLAPSGAMAAGLGDGVTVSTAVRCNLRPAPRPWSGLVIDVQPNRYKIRQDGTQCVHVVPRPLFERRVRVVRPAPTPPGALPAPTADRRPDRAAVEAAIHAAISAALRDLYGD